MEAVTAMYIAAGVEWLSFAWAAWLGFFFPRFKRMRRTACAAHGRVIRYERGAWQRDLRAYLYFPVVRFSVRGRAFEAVWSDNRAVSRASGVGDKRGMLEIFEGAPEIGDILTVNYNPRRPWENRLADDRLSHMRLSGLSMLGVATLAAAVVLAAAVSAR